MTKNQLKAETTQLNRFFCNFVTSAKQSTYL